MSRRPHPIFRHLTALALAASFAGPVFAQTLPGHWIRSFDWIEEPDSSQGTSTGNPALDEERNPVWRYGWTSGGAIGSANPWYLEPVTAMTWDSSWHASAASVWSVADDAGAHMRWTSLTHWLRGAGHGDFDSIPVMGFVNSTANSFSVDVVGGAELSWRGSVGSGPVVDVDFVVGHRDASTGAVTPLLVETHAKPTQTPTTESKVLVIDVLGVRLDPGDEVFWTMRGADETLNSRWISLYERFSVVRSRVGTSYCAPGATNSIGAHSRLVGVGSDRAADNDLTLVTFDVPNASFGFFLTSRTQGFTPNPAGSDGNLCLAGNIGRLIGPGQIQLAGWEQVVRLRLDLTQHPTPHLGLVQVVAGDTWNFQYWHRDVGGTSNFSTGLEVGFR